jgi:phosphoribosylformylglycinamidine (FGAM) synthase-like enzyme
VMGDTLDSSQSGGDAAIVRVHGTNKGLAICCDCNPHYVSADPYEGGKQAVAEAYRNLSAVGAEPVAITDNLNFGNPEKPRTMGYIVRAIEGMAEACRVLNFPVVSGNVSLYNETDGRAIPPTPVVGGVGLIADLSKTATLRGAAPGDVLVLVGETAGHLGASLYARQWLGLKGEALGAPPPVDLDAEADNAAFVRALIADGLASAVHDVSDGGVACAAAEMALAGGVGVTVSVADIGPDEHRATDLFCEAQARYLLAVKPEHQAEILRRGNAARINAGGCGAFGGDCVRFVQDPSGARVLGEVPLAALRAAHEGWLPGYMGAVG